jgi:hypothetical protein
MGVEEEGTHRQLKQHRKELVYPKIAEHRGTSSDHYCRGALFTNGPYAT